MFREVWSGLLIFFSPAPTACVALLPSWTRRATAQVELRATAALQHLATTVEELRYDVDTPAEIRWQEWADATLSEYAPVRRADSLVPLVVVPLVVWSW